MAGEQATPLFNSTVTSVPVSKFNSVSSSPQTQYGFQAGVTEIAPIAAVDPNIVEGLGPRGRSLLEFMGVELDKAA